MTNRFLTLLAFVAICVSCTKEISETPEADPLEGHAALTAKLAGEDGGEIVPGCVLVELDEKTTSLIADGHTEAIAELLSKTGAETLSPAVMIQPKNIAVAKKYGLHRWYSLGFDEEKSVREVAVKALSRLR